LKTRQKSKAERKPCIPLPGPLFANFTTGEFSDENSDNSDLAYKRCEKIKNFFSLTFLDKEDVVHRQKSTQKLLN
jgi:hypothetical protein